MALAADKRLKYEFNLKKKTLASDHEFRLKKNEGNRTNTLEAWRVEAEAPGRAWTFSYI